MIAKPDRNFGLDLLRAAAILAVLLFHARGLSDQMPFALQALFSRGWIGVDLFFVLSGFLIGSQLFRIQAGASKLPLRSYLSRFWIKRWTRTLPLYFVVLFVYVVLKPLFFHAPFRGGAAWHWIFFLQNYFPLEDFGQSWSLCVEEQFYLALPLVVFGLGGLGSGLRSALGDGLRVWLCLLPMLLSIGLRYTQAKSLGLSSVHTIALEDYLELFRFKLWMMLDSISVGLFLAATQMSWRAWNQRFRSGIGVLGALLLVATTVGFSEYPLTPFAISALYTLLAVSFGAIVVAAEQWAVAGRGLRIVQWIALWSYSAYLWHMLLIRVFSRYAASWQWSVRLWGFILVTFLVSWLSYELIERPGLSLRGRLLERPSERTLK